MHDFETRHPCSKLQIHLLFLIYAMCLIALSNKLDPSGLEVGYLNGVIVPGLLLYSVLAFMFISVLRLIQQHQ